MQPAIAIIGLAVLLCILLQHRNAKRKVQHTTGSTVERRISAQPRSSAKLVRHPYALSTPAIEEVGDLLHYKSLYHKLHNLEQHEDVVAQARDTLQSLLEGCMQVEAAREPDHLSIVALEEYDSDGLFEFIRREHETIFNDYENYVQRRRAGGRPELFSNRSEACAWLIRNAPNKLVDGAWLGDIHQVDTPLAMRPVTRMAFQILSEELGDGNLERNHVHLYRELLRTAGVQLPAPDSQEFMEENLGMDDTSAWRAGVGQLVISLFPHLYLPEILGFNLHFEILTSDTMRAAKELPLVGLPAMYFLVHISVDNADSGHTAQALQAVQRYMTIIEESEGREAAQNAWRRIKAGFVMSKNLGHEKLDVGLCKVDRALNPTEQRVLRMLRAKANVSQRLHCASRAKIGRHALMEWLSPEVLGDKSKGISLLTALANTPPWIVKGDANASRLVKELLWKGKMFGAFTKEEIAVLTEWINALPNGVASAKEGSLLSATSKLSRPLYTRCATPRDLRTACQATAVSETATLLVCPIFDWWLSDPIRRRDFSCIWLAHTALLQSTVRIPWRTSDALRCAVLAILRAEQGLPPNTEGPAAPFEHCGGLFDIGLRMGPRQDNNVALEFADVLGPLRSDSSEAVKLAYEMLAWSAQPEKNLGSLLGLAHAFCELPLAAVAANLYDETDRPTLQSIVARKVAGFEDCLIHMQGDRELIQDYQQGLAFGKSELRRVFV